MGAYSEMILKSLKMSYDTCSIVKTKNKMKQTKKIIVLLLHNPKKKLWNFERDIISLRVTHASWNSQRKLNFFEATQMLFQWIGVCGRNNTKET